MGLRAQLSFGLAIAFLLSSVLLWFATTSIFDRTQEVERKRAALSIARIIAEAHDIDVDEGYRSAAASLNEDVRGVRFFAGANHSDVGQTESRTFVEATASGGDRVRVYLAEPSDQPNSNLSRLLILYFAVTGLGMLTLAHVALTFWIVRPLGALHRASERFTAAATTGAAFAPVRVRGSEEVASLTRTFNAMADRIVRDRAALEERIQEVERATAELKEAQALLIRTEKLASVGRLAAGVAHEIGNPLAAILGLVEVLELDDADPAMRKEFLRRIHAETDRIHTIIRDLLDFARRGSVEAGDSVEAVDLVEVVEDAVRLMGPQRALSDITIERRFSEGTPLVHASPDRLRQVVLNLVINASDAMQGIGTSSAQSGAGVLTLEVFPDEDDSRFVVLAVADSGPGIPTEVLGRIFDPFVSTKPPGKGTGLGLAVCLSIVEAAGGKISATNPPGGGARFEIRLPSALLPD